MSGKKQKEPSIQIACSLSQGVQGVNESESCSVVSDSLQPHGLYSPWNSPCENTVVGSRSLLQGIFTTQGLNPQLLHWQADSLPLSHLESLSVYLKSESESHSVLSNSLRPNGLYTVRGILQARLLEWVAIPFSRRSSQPRNQTRVSCIA